MSGDDGLSDDADKSSLCIQYALEGERLCRCGQTAAGIEYLVSALSEGSDNLHALSAIYSQLGNAYFYMREYQKALEYHRHDLFLARAIGDQQGEGKASGNLGNTLKVLGKFDEAVFCCEKHLNIARNLADKGGEARALYNLGNVYHAKAKQMGRSNGAADMSSVSTDGCSQEARILLQTAAKYYEENLGLVETLNDKASKGRACGNLGNTHYLLGDFEKAIQYHNQRLALAKEFGDKAAMRRAYSNLGNAHIFLGQLDNALDYYKRALSLAQELGDKATEAQACYSLGNTCTLSGRHQEGVDYHKRHLDIARQLKDRVGESRACFSLANAYVQLKLDQKALYFLALNYKLAAEMGDSNGETTAYQALLELRSRLGEELKPDCSDDAKTNVCIEDVEDILASTHTDVGVRRRASADQLNLITAGSAASHRLLEQEKSLPTKSKATSVDEESFFDLVSRLQSKRIDDQRCDPKTFPENKENNGPRQADTLKPGRKWTIGPWDVTIDRHKSSFPRRPFQPNHASTPVPRNPLLDQSISGSLGTFEQSPEEFLDMIAGVQGRRMNDQRARLEYLPGLQNPQRAMEKLKKQRQKHAKSGQMPEVMPSVESLGGGGAQNKTDRKMSADEASEQVLDEDFINMLFRCQDTRIEEQRGTLPISQQSAAPTVPEDDIFQLVFQMQAGRYEDQRALLETSDDVEKNGVAGIRSKSARAETTASASSVNVTTAHSGKAKTSKDVKSSFQKVQKSATNEKQSTSTVNQNKR